LTPEHIWIAGRIPCLHWSGTVPTAAVIYMSGGGGRKEDVEPWIAELMTASAVDLYAIDMPGHGERQSPDAVRVEKPSPRDFLNLTEEVIEDLTVVTHYIREDDGIGTGKIGLRAISLSASCALAAIAAGVSIDACLSICGAGDHAGTAAYRAQRDGLSPSEVQQAMKDSIHRLVELQPLGKSDAFEHCSIFMVHGAHDQLVPLEHHHALFDALTPYYTDRPHDCMFLAHAGKHGIHRPIEEIGWTWLLDQVKGQTS
jgi:pimeloyl-ACP methyl ester carboxylesterase